MTADAIVTGLAFLGALSLIAGLINLGLEVGGMLARRMR